MIAEGDVEDGVRTVGGWSVQAVSKMVVTTAPQIQNLRPNSAIVRRAAS